MTIVTGLIFMVCVLLFRRGIVGEIYAWLERRNARPADSDAERIRTRPPATGMGGPGQLPLAAYCDGSGRIEEHGCRA